MILGKLEQAIVLAGQCLRYMPVWQVAFIRDEPNALSNFRFYCRPRLSHANLPISALMASSIAALIA